MTDGPHTVLVTGAAGFVGSFVAAPQAPLGHQRVVCAKIKHN